MTDIEKIYTDYAVPLKKYVLSLCGNPTVADDITAETFFKAIKNIDSFKGGKIFTWLCAIAKNTYFDYIGKKILRIFLWTAKFLFRIICRRPKTK